MRIYFAAPFTNIAVPNKKSDYGWVPNDYVKWLSGVIKKLESYGHEVHCPQRDDHKWGKEFPKLEELCPRQYEQITERTDLLVAYPGEPQSGGVMIEIGYAVAKKVPVLIIKRKGEKLTVIAQGLNSISPCDILEFEDDEELFRRLGKRLAAE